METTVRESYHETGIIHSQLIKLNSWNLPAEKLNENWKLDENLTVVTFWVKLEQTDRVTTFSYVTKSRLHSCPVREGFRGRGRPMGEAVWFQIPG